MSPALTPHTAYSVSSSASFLPLNPSSVIAPTDLFTSLGSPALLPQNSSQYSHSHSNSLQNLVDQTQALDFSHTHTHPPQSQQLAPHQPPPDAGSSTAAGSGRRGASASSKKARPSPLLKPTPDSSLIGIGGISSAGGGSTRRRRSGSEKDAAGTGKRSESKGRRSTTSSPFLGPTTAFSPLLFGSSMSQGSGSARSGLAGSGGVGSGSGGDGNNTPSPVDLAMSGPKDDLNLQQQGPGNMGPPPLPSSRRNSVTSKDNSNPTQDWAMMQPVTPASLMNFTREVTLGGLGPNVVTAHRNGKVGGGGAESSNPATGTKQKEKEKEKEKEKKKSKKDLEDKGAPTTTKKLAVKANLPIASTSATGGQKIKPLLASG